METCRKSSRSILFGEMGVSSQNETMKELEALVSQEQDWTWTGRGVGSRA